MELTDKSECVEEAVGLVDPFFIEDPSSSEDEEWTCFLNQKRHNGSRRASQQNRESSPPILFAFSTTPVRGMRDKTPSLVSSSEEEDEDTDEHIEDWMMLDGEVQEGDSSIQLNLSYWSDISSAKSSEDEGLSVKPVDGGWAVSQKDKDSAVQPLPSRFSMRSYSLTCHICSRTGHQARTCNRKKRPTCILCGVKGHVQRDCLSRICSSCGLASHGVRPCEDPPVWNQYCQRCGIIGHLSHVCPDTWRQYHLTTRSQIPLKPWTVHTIRDKNRYAHCYNCSVRGHHGYECTQRRMVSGLFPTLPYVCHYDTREDILQHHTRLQKGAKVPVNSGSHQLSEARQLSDVTEGNTDEKTTIQGRNRKKEEARRQAVRKKTWPERRRERQQVKKLRKEAQARREGGHIVRSMGQSDDHAYKAHVLNSHERLIQPQGKKEEGIWRKNQEQQRSRKLSASRSPWWL